MKSLWIGLFSLALAVGAQANTLTPAEATAQVKAAMANAEVASKIFYCLPGTLTCRTVFKMKDKTSGQIIEAFYENFFSSERGVGGAFYFLPTAPGSQQFNVYGDTKFDGVLEIDSVVPGNVATVNWNGDFPTIQNLTMLKLGTTQYAVATLTYTTDKAVMDGTSYDSANPSFQQAIHLEYPRLNR